MDEKRPGHSLEHDTFYEEKIRYEQTRAKANEEERRKIESALKAQRYESRQKTKERFENKLASMPRKVKFGIPAVVILVIIIVSSVIVPIVADQDETQYLAASDLKKAVNIDELSTVDYVYRGIAEKHSRFLWNDVVDYRVRYEAHISASYKMSDIEFSVDNENKSVIAYLPKATISKPQLDHTKFGYLPESATADIKDVISLCKRDAAKDVNNDEIENHAAENLKNTVRSLTLPFFEKDNLTLDFKPLSAYKKGEKK